MHPSQTPESRKAYRIAERQRVGEIIRAAKDKPCNDCGVKYPPYVMDFDHNGSVKSFGIATSIGRVAVSKIINEIMKCDVVCANCHRERTHCPAPVA